MSDATLFDWADGAARRDRGMALASGAQEREAPGWAERAYAHLEALSLTREFVYTDDLLAVFPERPAHPNAYGAVWQRAIRNGLLSRTGMMRESRDPKKHRHNYPLYRSEIYARRMNERVTG